MKQRFDKAFGHLKATCFSSNEVMEGPYLNEIGFVKLGFCKCIWSPELLFPVDIKFALDTFAIVTEVYPLTSEMGRNDIMNIVKRHPADVNAIFKHRNLGGYISLLRTDNNTTVYEFNGESSF